MRKCWPLALSLLLFACAEPDARRGADTTGSESAAHTVDLTGEWVVSRVAGRSLASYVDLKAENGLLYWEPLCAGKSVGYTIEGTTITFRRKRYEGVRTVCLPASPADLPGVLGALEGSWTARRLANGDILLTGEKGEMRLERPRTRDGEDLSGAYRVTAIDGAALGEQPLPEFKADRHAIWWEPRCAGLHVPYTLVNERFVVVELPPAPPPPPPPSPPGEPPAPVPVVCAIAPPPAATQAIDAIRAAESFERIEGGVRLSGGGRSVTLRTK